VKVILDKEIHFLFILPCFGVHWIQ